jgi:hypothetical protein
LEEWFNNYNNKESHKGRRKGERPCFIIQVSPQNPKVENHKEQEEK